MTSPATGPEFITRSDYMEGKASHREFYGQFVNDDVIKVVVASISSKKILGTEDKHFNDISNDFWDRVPMRHYMPIQFSDVGDFPSQAGLTCVAKEAARQYVERWIDEAQVWIEKESA